MAEVAGMEGWCVFDQVPGALVLTDDDMVVVRVNDALCRLVGLVREDLVGRDAYAFLPATRREAARERLAALRSDGRSYSVEECFEHADGREVWLRLHVGTLRDERGRRYVIGQVEDTTDHRRVTTRLQRLAERDDLTGLLNRRRFEEELEKALAGARRHDHEAALILVGLEAHGDLAGDRVLSLIAATLATRVREEDAVARLGGEQFAVLLRGTSLEAAEGVAAELVALVADTGFMRERGVTIRTAVAALTAETPGAQAAVHAADVAMHAGVRERDRTVVHAAAPALASSAAQGSAEAPERAPADAYGLLGRLQAVADAPTIDHALRAVRDLLGMDIAYVTHHTETEQVLVATEGDPASFGVATGARIPLEQTYCHLILRGELPAAMPDVQAVRIAAALPITEAAGVGAYASVPIRLSDGTLYGTLCAANHAPVSQLGERDVQFLAVLARLVAGELERDASLRAQLALQVQAAGTGALLSAIEARDRYTGTHSREVVELATAVAAELALPEHVQRQVAQIALLHDIGKLALPDSILSKPGPLTHDEIELMRRHPEDGERIVAAIPELAHLAPGIRAEHERWDGTGYPDGLAGEDIPITSRVVFVCDAWDAMTSDRPYRSRMPRDEALAELAAGAGSQFCDVCVQALFAVLARS
jgi:diguanylate cyclase (GGDEF)-like protein/PAS domain S-box-containing protein